MTPSSALIPGFYRREKQRIDQIRSQAQFNLQPDVTCSVGGSPPTLQRTYSSMLLSDVRYCILMTVAPTEKSSIAFPLTMAGGSASVNPVIGVPFGTVFSSGATNVISANDFE